MSNDPYAGRDPLDIAREAERDLNSQEVRRGASDSTTESGVDAAAAERFPGGSVTYGSAASGAGDNREIPESEGGGFDDKGRPTKARDFEGAGGPEDKAQIYADENAGNNDVRGNIRQGGETLRPLGGGGSASYSDSQEKYATNEERRN